MAVGFAVTSKGDQYNGKMTLFVILSCMMAAMGGVIFGYDIGISGGVTSMEPFLKKFFPKVYTKMKEDNRISNYCKFDSQLLTSFTSSLYIAGLVASFFASSVTRAYGRKPSIIAGGAAFLAGAALGGAAVNVYMLILGRLLLGIGVGFANQSVPLYLSEMAPPNYRGAFNNGFQFSIGIGALSANLINYGTQKIKGGWGWRISLGMAAVPASILTLGALFLPDTANSLIQRSNDHQKAKVMLQRVRGTTTDVQAELDDLIKASEISKTMEDHPFRKILQTRYRPQLVMAIAIPFFQQVTGINVIAFYAPLLFRTIGFGESASLMAAVVTGLVGTGSTFISMLIVDKLGRRVLFMVGGVQMLISQLMIGGIMAAQLGDHSGLSKGYSYLVLLLICVYVAGFGWSWGPLGWLVPSEIFQLEIRSAGQSITVAVSFLFTFIIAQTFLSMLCHFKSGIFFFFGGWVAVMTVFVYLLLPETKNLPIEVMDRVWGEHWFWKRILMEEEKGDL
ncbi:hexose carrier protein HEX6-like [Telopea speciosissima]|uniref:hexose carrier protein HEX6-like n=1 Tax=Telopea speciosissima TaxID=54955 RepID=UPI001CC657F7|nr:hexose carrier protein HEX6-like [Telopea speciosissima]